VTIDCGKDFPHGETINSRRAAGRLEFSTGGYAIEKMLLVPFRSGTTHVVIFRSVFPHGPVPGWTEKRQQRADGAAEKSNDRQAHRECSAGSEWRVTQLSFGRS
jgi:hypothetical protein